MIKSASDAALASAVRVLCRSSGHDAKVVHFAAQRFEQATQHEAIRVVDAARWQRLTRHHQLVTGKQSRNPQPAEHGKPRRANRSGERAVLRFQPHAGLQHRVPPGDIDACLANRLAARRPLAQGHFVAYRFALFLHDDRVGSRRDRCTGKNARGSTRLQRTAHLTRRDALADAQRRGNARNIDGAHCVAVHLRVVEWRHVDRRYDFDRKHATRGPHRVDRFDVGNGMRGRKQLL